MERNLAIGAVLLGAVVAAALAPKDGDFVPNALFFWLSQLNVRGYRRDLHPGRTGARRSAHQSSDRV